MSSKRRIRKKSCEGKQRFDTANDAQTSAFHLRVNGHIFNYYKCKFCKKYHFGHRPKQYQYI